MKIFRFFAIALVAMLGLVACNNDCEHEFIEVDYSEALVGTWTYLSDEGLAEAMVINPDGSFEVTGIMQGGSLYESKGTIKVVNNKISLVFEGETEATEGRLELVAGKSMSIVINDEYDIRLTYDYCKEDLADEVVGMWVLNDGVAGMAIQIYQEDGKSIYTGFSYGANDYMVNKESTYKVVGDLMFQQIGTMHFVTRLTYLPNGNALGDILNTTATIVVNNEPVTSSYSFLRIRQSLDLSGRKYDYIKTFVTNVKGLDKDIDFMGYTFNFAKMDGVKLDKMLKTLLFTVEFPDANTIKYGCHYNNEPMSMEAPISVDGNKMTVKMSAKNAAFRDIDLYTFQDQDNSQMHMYMPTYAFVNFFGNMQCTIMSQLGQLDLTDEAAVKAVYDSIDEAVETINVSFVMTKAAR